MLSLCKCTLFIHPMESSGLGPCLRRDSRSRISLICSLSHRFSALDFNVLLLLLLSHMLRRRHLRSAPSLTSAPSSTCQSRQCRHRPPGRAPQALVPNPSGRLRTVLNMQIFPFAVSIETFSRIDSLGFTTMEDISASIDDNTELAWPDDLLDAPEFQDVTWKKLLAL